MFSFTIGNLIIAIPCVPIPPFPSPPEPVLDFIFGVDKSVPPIPGSPI